MFVTRTGERSIGHMYVWLWLCFIHVEHEHSSIGKYTQLQPYANMPLAWKFFAVSEDLKFGNMNGRGTITETLLTTNLLRHLNHLESVEHFKEANRKRETLPELRASSKLGASVWAKDQWSYEENYRGKTRGGVMLSIRFVFVNPLHMLLFGAVKYDR